MDKVVRVSDVIDWFSAYSHMDEKIPFDVLVTDLKDAIPAADVFPMNENSHKMEQQTFMGGKT